MNNLIGTAEACEIIGVHRNSVRLVAENYAAESHEHTIDLSLRGKSNKLLFNPDEIQAVADWYKSKQNKRGKAWTGSDPTRVKPVTATEKAARRIEQNAKLTDWIIEYLSKQETPGYEVRFTTRRRAVIVPVNNGLNDF